MPSLLETALARPFPSPDSRALDIDSHSILVEAQNIVLTSEDDGFEMRLHLAYMLSYLGLGIQEIIAGIVNKADTSNKPREVIEINSSLAVLYVNIDLEMALQKLNVAESAGKMDDITPYLLIAEAQNKAGAEPEVMLHKAKLLAGNIFDGDGYILNSHQYVSDLLRIAETRYKLGSEPSELAEAFKHASELYDKQHADTRFLFSQVARSYARCGFLQTAIDLVRAMDEPPQPDSYPASSKDSALYEIAVELASNGRFGEAASLVSEISHHELSATGFLGLALEDYSQAQTNIQMAIVRISQLNPESSRYHSDRANLFALLARVYLRNSQEWIPTMHDAVEELKEVEDFSDKVHGNISIGSNLSNSGLDGSSFYHQAIRMVKKMSILSDRHAGVEQGILFEELAEYFIKNGEYSFAKLAIDGIDRLFDRERVRLLALIIKHSIS